MLFERLMDLLSLPETLRQHRHGLSFHEQIHIFVLGRKGGSFLQEIMQAPRILAPPQTPLASNRSNAEADLLNGGYDAWVGDIQPALIELVRNHSKGF